MNKDYILKKIDTLLSLMTDEKREFVVPSSIGKITWNRYNVRMIRTYIQEDTYVTSWGRWMWCCNSIYSKVKK